MTRMTLSGTKIRAISANYRNRKAMLARSVALAALLGVTGCNSLSSMTASEPDPSVKLAGIFLNAGASDAALRAADDALTRQPRNAAALKARADALVQMGRTEDAQIAYAALIAATPSDIAPRIALGRMLVQNNPAAAEQLFAEVLARAPGNAIAMNNMGIARDLQGRHVEAQAAYRAARAVDPKMTGASVNLGLSQVLAGDMNEAVRTLSPLAALDDAPAAVHENLGIALAARGETAEAKRVMARVMSPAEITVALAQVRRTGAPQVAAIAPRPAAPTPVQAAPIAAAPIAAAPIAAVPIAAVPIAALPVPLTAVAVPVALVQPVARAQPVAPAVAPIAVVAEPAPAALLAEPVRQAGMAVAMPIAPGTPVAVPPARSGAAYAQLAMAQSAGRARARWGEISASQQCLLADRRLVVAATSYRDQAVWAVRTGPFASPRQAESFCQQLIAAGQDCWAIIPAPDAAPDAAPGATSAEATATPATSPATSPVTAAAIAAPAAPLAPRATYAQLAASDSEAAVVGEWERLQRKIGTLLRDRQQITMAAEVAGRQVWRLRTGPFEQPRAAEAFCAEVRAVGGKCWAATGS